MAIKKKRKKKTTTATKKRTAAKPKKKRAPKKVSRTSQPAFLTIRQFKKLAEATRRQRISYSHQGRAAATAARAVPAAGAEIDFATGFDPYEDD